VIGSHFLLPCCDWLTGLWLPSNLRLVFEKVTISNLSYPINHLRNLALDSARTSHVFVCDVDMLPSPDLCALATAAVDQINMCHALNGLQFIWRIT
jgi:hypothetical protein